VCLGVGPSDPWIELWIIVNLEILGGNQIPHCVGGELQWNLCLFGVFFVCSMSPTFMLGIWHGDDWLKRDLAQRIYGQVEYGSPISGWFIFFIKEEFIPLVSCVNVLIYMWILCLIYLWYFCCYYVGYMYVL